MIDILDLGKGLHPSNFDIVRKGNDDWALRSFVMDILDPGKGFASIKFRYISKVLNVATHSIAKFTFKFNLKLEYFYSFPDRLSS